MTNSERARKTTKEIRLDNPFPINNEMVEEYILSTLNEAVQEKQKALTKIVAITNCKFAKQLAREALEK